MEETRVYSLHSPLILTMMRLWRTLTNTAGYHSALRGGVRYLWGKRGQRKVRGLRLSFQIRMSVVLRAGASLGRLARKNEVRLWVDGRSVFRRLDRLIRHAQHHIIVQMFIWKNDTTGRHVAKMLVDAADRGVDIDITKEAVGDIFEFSGNFLATKDSHKEPWIRFWNHPRIHITYATQNDHAKVFVIDGNTLLLTGMNIANEYRLHWHDYMVELRGERFVDQFLAHTLPAHDESLRLVMNTEDNKEIRPVLMNLLNSAQEHVIMEQCYFSDPDIVQTLIDLSHRHVRVIVIVPKKTDFHHHANMGSIGRLLTEGDRSHVTVLLYPHMSHAKAVIVDHKKAFIGSANAFRASLDEMGEVNVLVQRKHRIVWRLRETMSRSILRSRALSGPPRFLWFSRWLALLGL